MFDQGIGGVHRVDSGRLCESEHHGAPGRIIARMQGQTTVSGEFTRRFVERALVDRVRRTDRDVLLYTSAATFTVGLAASAWIGLASTKLTDPMALESTLVAALAATLVLVWVRARTVTRRRSEEEELKEPEAFIDVGTTFAGGFSNRPIEVATGPTGARGPSGPMRASGTAASGPMGPTGPVGSTGDSSM